MKHVKPAPSAGSRRQREPRRARRLSAQLPLILAVVWCNASIAVGPINIRTQTHAVFHNDVWSSLDGVNWTKHATPPWSSGPCKKGHLIAGSSSAQLSFKESSG
jgi:hypothetical protein